MLMGTTITRRTLWDSTDPASSMERPGTRMDLRISLRRLTAAPFNATGQAMAWFRGGGKKTGGTPVNFFPGGAVNPGDPKGMTAFPTPNDTAPRVQQRNMPA